MRKTKEYKEEFIDTSYKMFMGHVAFRVVLSKPKHRNENIGKEVERCTR